MSRRPARLCMVVHGDYPADVRVAREARAALAAGFLVDVVATRGPGERKTERVEGILVHRLPITHRRGAGTVRFVAEYVGFTTLAAARLAALALRRRPDVVQVHNPPDFLVLAALMPRVLGSRLVFDVHDLSSDMFAMRFGEGILARVATRILEHVERLACRASDVVVTVHEPYRLELGRRGVDSGKTLVILNSVDETVLPTERRLAAPVPFRIVYHGTVTPHYGLDLLLDAFGRLPDSLADARLQVLGGGDAIPDLVARAQRLGVADRVELNGIELPQTEVLRRVQGASVGVIPNLPTRLNHFALSTKLFEYVALGIPVVTADLPTIRAHFTEAEVSFYRAGHADALAAALAGVATDYECALAKARAALEHYRADYEWPRQADNYVRMLDRLATAAAS